VKNVAASVRQRLLNKARVEQRPFNELLQYYAMERFLYRLSQSRHAKKFILKGALMLRAWQSSEFRPTMDIDLLGKTSNQEDSLKSQARDILTVEVEDDGLVFDPETIRAESITEDADYHGMRIRFDGKLGTARVRMQIDIGFGDIIYPEATKSELPTMLDHPAPSLLCYSRESAIAEKFEAMVKLGELNSRMKDFYDIWLLSRLFDFGGNSLSEAIRLTFENRETAIPLDVPAFGAEFAESKQVLWKAFQQRLKQEHVPASFSDIVSAVASFLGPLATANRENQPYVKKWCAPGPWT